MIVRAVEEALLRLGSEFVRVLRKEAARTRPDRRPKLERLVDAIESRTSTS